MDKSDQEKIDNMDIFHCVCGSGIFGKNINEPTKCSRCGKDLLIEPNYFSEKKFTT